MTTAEQETPSVIGPPLDRHKGWLVTQGNGIGREAKDNRDWKNQVRVLQEAAQEETEPLVLLNLLRYQAARNKNWRQPRDVVTPLGKLMEECIDRADGDGRFAIELIQHLLLYTVRAYTYESKSFSVDDDPGETGGREVA